MYLYNNRLYDTQMSANAIQKKANEILMAHPEYKPVEVAEISHSNICSSWWGQAWCNNLERHVNWGNRVERGKKYVRNGAVTDLQINGGEILAHVIGKAIEPYEVKIKIFAISPERQIEIEHIASGKIHKLEELASGNFPDDLKEAFFQKGILFPQPDEIEFSCNCQDTSYMCQHVAAALYGIGIKIDSNPFFLFQMRGVNIDQFIGKIVSNKVENMLINANIDSPRILKDVDLVSMFGIGLTEQLFSCPFCGHNNFEWDEITEEENLHWFTCMECGASIASGSTVEEIIKRWNQRPNRYRKSRSVLQTCPCCGSDHIEKINADMWYCFKCKECGCESGGAETESVAIDDWNGKFNVVYNK